jgi:hypothetical protein
MDLRGEAQDAFMAGIVIEIKALSARYRLHLEACLSGSAAGGSHGLLFFCHPIRWRETNLSRSRRRWRKMRRMCSKYGLFIDVLAILLPVVV